MHGDARMARTHARKQARTHARTHAKSTRHGRGTWKVRSGREIKDGGGEGTMGAHKSETASMHRAWQSRMHGRTRGQEGSGTCTINHRGARNTQDRGGKRTHTCTKTINSSTVTHTHTHTNTCTHMHTCTQTHTHVPHT